MKVKRSLLTGSLLCVLVCMYAFVGDDGGRNLPSHEEQLPPK